MFQAIEIDGEAYWDGGYSGNPTLSTLIRETKAKDTILIPINPIERLPPPVNGRRQSKFYLEVSSKRFRKRSARSIAS